VAYVWCACSFIDTFIQDLKKCGFKINPFIVWNKDMFALGMTDYQQKHEPCLYATRGNHNWKGGRSQTTVWDIPMISHLKKEEGEWGHSTQKPIECMKRPIENNSDEGDYVYDPFCGSGTTIIAAERTGRKCLACELNPVYCDAIIRRWEQETGERAIRESDGLAFDDLVS
jgi:DNA modification methylase